MREVPLYTNSSRRPCSDTASAGMHARRPRQYRHMCPGSVRVKLGPALNTFRHRWTVYLHWNPSCKTNGRGTMRAEDAQGKPTQSHISPSILVTPTQRHISPSILVYEDNDEPRFSRTALGFARWMQRAMARRRHLENNYCT